MKTQIYATPAVKGLKVTHGTKLVEIDFTVFLTIFKYAESNAELCQA